MLKYERSINILLVLWNRQMVGRTIGPEFFDAHYKEQKITLIILKFKLNFILIYMKLNFFQSRN